MQSKKINELATNLVPSVNDLTVVGDSATGQLKKITLSQISALFGSAGSVSSVAMSVPTGLTVTGSPITTSGTLAVTFTAGYSIPTTAKQTEWDAGYADRLKWDGGASGLNAVTARSSLGLVIGTNVLAYRTFGSAANNNTGDFATAAQGVNADTAYSLRLTGASTPLSISGNVISINQATTSTNGFLTSTNWNTFNNKIGGSGTEGTIALFNSSGTISDSLIVQSEGTIGFGYHIYAPSAEFRGDSSFRTTSGSNGSAIQILLGTTVGSTIYSIIKSVIVDNSADFKGRLDFLVRNGNNSFITALSLAHTGVATIGGALNAISGSFINSSGTGLDVASDKVIFRSNIGVGTPRQVEISMGGGTPTFLDAKGYGANYLTDFGIRTYNSSGTAFNVFYGTSAGKVGIGTTNPATKLEVVGQVSIGQQTNGTASIDAYSGAAYYGSSGAENGLRIYNNGNYLFTGSNVSDERAKENISNLDFNAIEKINALEPKSYYMKHNLKKLRYGFIAQDINKILPDLVEGDLNSEEYIGLDYNGIITVLVKAIQEQQTQLEELKELIKNK